MTDDIRYDVRNRLIEKALSGEPVYYGDLMKEFHIPRGHRSPGIGIGWIVGKISEYESRKNKPLISAIVVRRGSENKICTKGCPGKGFFGIHSDQIPEDLRAIAFSDKDKRLEEKHFKFVAEMQARVWGCASWEE